MSFRHFSYSPVLGYASLALADQGLERLQKYLRKIPFETDTIAEGVCPCEEVRPVFNEVLALIERRAITTLVVPSLRHLTGNDLEALAKVLRLFRLRGVRLKSLAEWVDSSRLSDREIMIRAKRRKFKTESVEATNYLRGAI